MRRLSKLEKKHSQILKNPRPKPRSEKLRPKHSARRTKKLQQKPRPRERQPLLPPELLQRRLMNFNLPLERRETSKWLLSTRKRWKQRKLPSRRCSRMCGPQAPPALPESRFLLLHSHRLRK